MMEAASCWLDRYSPSAIKEEATRLLSQAARSTSTDRSLRLVVYDVVYAFQRLEARRLGLRADRSPAQYAKFRQDFIAALAMWVPGKDPFVDGIREAVSIAAKHNDAVLNDILQGLLAVEARRTSDEQRRRASSPRKAKAIDEYIWSVLAKKPAITLDELWEQMSQDEFGRVIEEIEHDRVWVAGNCYTRGSIRNRFYRIRKVQKKSQ